MAFEIAHLTMLPVCRLDSLDIPPAIFHDVFPRIHFTASHCPPCKVNDFNLATLGALDKLGRLDEANSTISANRASASFSEKEYSYQHQRG